MPFIATYTPGGKTWAKVLGKDENTGAIDVVFDPHNPNTLFAALWQVRRQPSRVVDRATSDHQAHRLGR